MILNGQVFDVSHGSPLISYVFWNGCGAALSLWNDTVPFKFGFLSVTFFSSCNERVFVPLQWVPAFLHHTIECKRDSEHQLPRALHCYDCQALHQVTTIELR